MRLFNRAKIQPLELALGELPWVPDGLAQSLSSITSFLVASFDGEVSLIGLYGSWQRGDASPASDVDLVVFLNHEVIWFDAEHGMASPAEARKDRLRWHAIEHKANRRRRDARVYSIAVVTPGMLAYYRVHAPVHLQNWAHAITHCYPLWSIASS